MYAPPLLIVLDIDFRCDSSTTSTRSWTATLTCTCGGDRLSLKALAKSNRRSYDWHWLCFTTCQQHGSEVNHLVKLTSLETTPSASSSRSFKRAFSICAYNAARQFCHKFFAVDPYSQEGAPITDKLVTWGMCETRYITHVYTRPMGKPMMI